MRHTQDGVEGSGEHGWYWSPLLLFALATLLVGIFIFMFSVAKRSGYSMGMVEFRRTKVGMSLVDRFTGDPVDSFLSFPGNEQLQSLGARLGDGEWGAIKGMAASTGEYFDGRVRVQVTPGVLAASLLADIEMLATPKYGIWRFILICGSDQVSVWVEPQVAFNDRFPEGEFPLLLIRQEPKGGRSANVQIGEYQFIGGSATIVTSTEAEGLPPTQRAFSSALPVCVGGTLTACELISQLRELATDHVVEEFYLLTCDVSY